MHVTRLSIILATYVRNGHALEDLGKMLRNEANLLQGKLIKMSNTRLATIARDRDGHTLFNFKSFFFQKCYKINLYNPTLVPVNSKVLPLLAHSAELLFNLWQSV